MRLRDREFSNRPSDFASTHEAEVPLRKRRPRKGGGKTVDPRASAPLSPSDRFFSLFSSPPPPPPPPPPSRSAPPSPVFLLLRFVRPLGGYGERFIATRFLAVATFCGFRRRKKFRFRNRRLDTGRVTATCGAKCPFFFRPVANRRIILNRTPRRNTAYRGVLRLSLNRRDIRFSYGELAMTYDAVGGVFLPRHNIYTAG